MSDEKTFNKYAEQIKRVEVTDKDLKKIRDEAVVAINHAHYGLSKGVGKWSEISEEFEYELKQDINDVSPFFNPVEKCVDVVNDLITEYTIILDALAERLVSVLELAEEINNKKQEKVYVAVYGQPLSEKQIMAFTETVKEQLLRIKEDESLTSAVDWITAKNNLKRDFGIKEEKTERAIIFNNLWQKYMEAGEEMVVDAPEKSEVVMNPEKILDEKDGETDDFEGTE